MSWQTQLLWNFWDGKYISEDFTREVYEILCKLGYDKFYFYQFQVKFKKFPKNKKILEENQFVAPFSLDVCTLVTSFRRSALFVMSIDQFHGCYPGDTTLCTATERTSRHSSRNTFVILKEIPQKYFRHDHRPISRLLRMRHTSFSLCTAVKTHCHKRTFWNTSRNTFLILQKICHKIIYV